MSSRKKMAAPGILSKRTAGQALELVTASHPKVVLPKAPPGHRYELRGEAEWVREVPSGPVDPRVRDVAFPEGAVPPGTTGPDRQWFTLDGPLERVMYSVTQAQRRALVKEAVRRMELAGGGKPDASVVLREILDAWMASR